MGWRGVGAGVLVHLHWALTANVATRIPHGVRVAITHDELGELKEKLHRQQFSGESVVCGARLVQDPEAGCHDAPSWPLALGTSAAESQLGSVRRSGDRFRKSVTAVTDFENLSQRVDPAVAAVTDSRPSSVLVRVSCLVLRSATGVLTGVGKKGHCETDG